MVVFFETDGVLVPNYTSYTNVDFVFTNGTTTNTLIIQIKANASNNKIYSQTSGSTSGFTVTGTNSSGTTTPQTIVVTHTASGLPLTLNLFYSIIKGS